MINREYIQQDYIIENSNNLAALMEENKITFSNGLIRYLRLISYKVLDFIKAEIEILMLDKQTMLYEMIDKTFNNMGDFNNYKFDCLIGELDSALEGDCNKINDKIKEQKSNIINRLMNIKFQNDIFNLLNENIDKNLFTNDELTELKMENKPFNYKRFILQENELIRLTGNNQKDITHIENITLFLEERLNLINELDLKLKIRKLEMDKNSMQLKHIKRLNAMGDRPKETQIYRQVEAVESWFVFKKRTKKLINGGINYKAVDDWNEKKDLLIQEFIKEEAFINNKINNLNEILLEKKHIEAQLTNLNNIRNSMYKNEFDYSKEFLHMMEDDMNSYILRQKNELYESLVDYINENYENLNFQLNKCINQMIIQEKENIQKVVLNIIMQYKTEGKSNILEVTKN